MNNIDMLSKFARLSKLPSDSRYSNEMTLKYSRYVCVYTSKLDEVSPQKELYKDSQFSLTNFEENNTYREYVLSKPTNSSLLERKLINAMSVKFMGVPNSSTPHNLANVNFLRKERLYTKLKYSRSPAYDIVSGGSAALLAAFLGFLISEKYGFEMVDSGDFYFLFMYLVFISFSIRPLLTTLSDKDSVSSILSVKPIVSFFLNLFYLLANKFK